MSDVSRAIASIPAHFYWLMGKGRTRPSEPLYAVQVIDPESGIAIAEAEAEQLAEAIDAAVKQLNISCPSLLGDTAPRVSLLTERTYDDETRHSAEQAMPPPQPLAPQCCAGADPSGLASAHGGDPDGEAKETVNRSSILDEAGKTPVRDRPGHDRQVAVTDPIAKPHRPEGES